MKKAIVIFSVLVFFIAESTCQRFILPTYRPPPKRIQIQRARRDINDEPLWLHKGDNGPHAPATGDHPTLPRYIDDIKLDPNTRVARSLGTPGVSRGSSGSRSTSSTNTGPTHPGYNRRNARDVNDEPLWLHKDNDGPRAPATGEHPTLPKYIDDIKLDPNRRVARSLGTPSVSRGSSGPRSSSSRNTGPTHPGYNRRNARDIRLPGKKNIWPKPPPFNPKSKYPWNA